MCECVFVTVPVSVLAPGVCACSVAAVGETGERAESDGGGMTTDVDMVKEEEEEEGDGEIRW